ncbi:MAG: hypothetical protein EOM46_17790 [Gammaproteobacteria bacterium]|nr:hypothetical protein [Gammaproteobacteria bacterium]
MRDNLAILLQMAVKRNISMIFGACPRITILASGCAYSTTARPHGCCRAVQQQTQQNCTLAAGSTDSLLGRAAAPPEWLEPSRLLHLQQIVVLQRLPLFSATAR